MSNVVCPDIEESDGAGTDTAPIDPTDDDDNETGSAIATRPETGSTPVPPPPPPNCRKASNWDLEQAGIDDEHAYKSEAGVPGRLSMFDICKCSDGSIRIARTKMCGKTSDFWDY
jgi:hypothetical protein